MIYLERLRNVDRQHFETACASDLYLASLVCATKYLHDDSEPEYVYNDEWAMAAEASCSSSTKFDAHRITQLELDMLRRLDWNLHVDANGFDTMLANVEQRVAWTEWTQRTNGATYAELTAIYDTDRVWLELVRPVMAVG
jgi:hypothetical protein